MSARRRDWLLAVAVVAGLYGAYRATLAAAPDYLFSTFPQPISFNADVLSGKFHSGSPRVLLLGDSTAGMNYAADELPGTLSLAMFASSLAESYFTLRRYLEARPPPRCIVISDSYAWAYKRDFGFWDTYVFHGFYSWSDLRDLYLTGAAAGEYGAGTLGQALFFGKALLYRAKLAGIHLTSPEETPLEAILRNHLANVATRDQLRKGLGTMRLDSWHYVHDADSLAHLYRPFTPAPINDRYLERILDLAHSRHIAVHWIQPPVAESALEETVRNHYGHLTAHLSPLVLAYEGNTFEGTPTPYPARLMANPVHLSSAGVEKFTAAVRPLFERCQ